MELGRPNPPNINSQQFGSSVDVCPHLWVNLLQHSSRGDLAWLVDVKTGGEINPVINPERAVGTC